MTGIIYNAEFENFYESIYKKRWPLLRESLLAPAQPLPYSERLLKPYMMDRASILAAMTLRLPDSGVILDACAAPGGKSLVLCSKMEEETYLISNELSKERRRRLCLVLDEHLDKEKRQRVKVTGFDAAKMGGRKYKLPTPNCGENGRFGSILLDVPCSGERYVIQDKAALDRWTPSRPRFLSQRQWSLLSSAFLLLKEGGSLVYVTCAISPEENDGVIRRLFGKYQTQVILDIPDFTEGEKTEYGKMIMPDQCNGMGPMYVARFSKLKTVETGPNTLS
jgi:16S rRNA (cytosine1407-C5)-methyltransferase